MNLSYVDGTGGPDSLLLYCGLPYGQLPTPTKEGYDFEGWYTGPNGTGTKVTPYTEVPKSAVYRLYACWKEKEVQIPTVPPETTVPPATTVPPVTTAPPEITTPVHTTPPTEAPTDPPDATTAPTQPTTVPATQEPGTVPPFSQIPIQRPDGTTQAAPQPQEPASRLNIWYILAPAGVLVLLLILLLVWKKRKQK